MTRREAIYRLQRVFRQVNADSRFSNKLAHSMLQSSIRLLIYRDSKRLKLLKKTNLFKTLKCIEVIQAPKIDPCCGVRSLCTVWRTKDRLPKIYEDAVGPLIRGVYTIDGSKKIDLIEAREFEKKMLNPWSKKTLKDKKYAFYNDGYIYFPNGAYKMVEVDAYWEESIKGLSCVDNSDDSGDSESCDLFLDESLNVPDYLEKPMFDMTEQEIANTYLRVKETSHQIDKNDNTLNIKS